MNELDSSPWLNAFLKIQACQILKENDRQMYNGHGDVLCKLQNSINLLITFGLLDTIFDHLLPTFVKVLCFHFIWTFSTTLRLQFETQNHQYFASITAKLWYLHFHHFNIFILFNSFFIQTCKQKQRQWFNSSDSLQKLNYRWEFRPLYLSAIQMLTLDHERWFKGNRYLWKKDCMKVEDPFTGEKFKKNNTSHFFHQVLLAFLLQNALGIF